MTDDGELVYLVVTTEDGRELAISIAQLLVGAANPWTDFSRVARAAHLSLATLLWANAALMAVLIWLPLWKAGRNGGAATVE